MIQWLDLPISSVTSYDADKINTFHRTEPIDTYSNSLSLFSFLKKKIPDDHCLELWQINWGCFFTHYSCFLYVLLLLILQKYVWELGVTEIINSTHINQINSKEEINKIQTQNHVWRLSMFINFVCICFHTCACMCVSSVAPSNPWCF
jgi:hypothetical protein